jgi:redox-sensitive bicupin YhaK (pirin superfamily)
MGYPTPRLSSATLTILNIKNIAMITIRKSSERGHSQIGWLDSFHTFSFSNYYDAEYMGFGNLRVINQDTVQPDNGFGRHAHQNMEIISYVIDGALEHKDSMGTGSIVTPGEIQRMSAGLGVEHSEFNHSKEKLLHFLQIWIVPDQQSIPPSYEQKSISQEKNKLILIGSPKGGDGAVLIHQYVKLYVAYMTSQHSLEYSFAKERKGWLQLIKGSITLADKVLSAGDGASIADEENIEIICDEHAEFLLFDLT